MQVDNSWAAGPENMYKTMSVKKILGENGTGRFFVVLDYIKDHGEKL